MATTVIVVAVLLTVAVVILAMVRADSDTPKRKQFRAQKEQVRIMRTAMNAAEDATMKYREIDSVLAGEIRKITTAARTEMEKHTP